MRKNDFWILSLIALFIIGIVLNWNIWITIAVIANSLLVLFDVAVRLYKMYQRGKHE